MILKSRARACWGMASRKSAPTASRCCSCIRRIFSGRWLIWSRRDGDKHSHRDFFHHLVGGPVCRPAVGSAQPGRKRRHTGRNGPRRADNRAHGAQADLDDGYRRGDFRRVLRSSGGGHHFAGKGHPVHEPTSHVSEKKAGREALLLVARYYPCPRLVTLFYARRRRSIAPGLSSLPRLGPHVKSRFLAPVSRHAAGATYPIAG